MVEKIIHNEILIAIIIRADYSREGIEFFTPPEFSQQLGYMKRPQGYQIKPHTHQIRARAETLPQEVLYIKSGRINIDFYDTDLKFLESKIVTKGDVVLLASGGHGFEMLEISEIIEMKQGPYYSDQDKKV